MPDVPPATPTSGPPAWAIAIVTVAAVAGIGYMLFGDRLTEPEVVHDLDGQLWYRIQGPDAEQRAIEACFKLDNRWPLDDTRRSILATALNKPIDTGGRFCCVPRESPTTACDRPRGRLAAAE